jgi:CRISP-associated protein Cas1
MSGGTPSAPGVSEPGLLPVRMLNEYTYCPRLYWLMHLEGRWADNAYTAEGKRLHRRVDSKETLLPAQEEMSLAEGDPEPKVARSVTLQSEILGITAKLDLAQVEGDTAVPVETKRGKVPDNPQRSWEPERVQIMAQGLLLREQGYKVEYGVLYYQGSRVRVSVEFTPELETRTRELILAAKTLEITREVPDPLVDSPKCNGCSLNGICLPDETNLLKARRELSEIGQDEAGDKESSSEEAATGKTGWEHVRRLYPPRDDALPLYVQEQGAYVGKKGDCLVISKQGEELAKARLKDVSQLVLCGNVSLSAQTIHLLCESGIPVAHLSMGHWFYGITSGFGLKNAYAKAAQFKASADRTFCLRLAKSIVAAKGQNQRTMLRRNSDKDLDPELESMGRLIKKVENVASLEELLGIEGNLAGYYFASFKHLIRPKAVEDLSFDFNARNRRPPKDPVNAMLSFGYTMLAKECAIALTSAGLDPHWGFYHQPRHGRPALALDLMEEFRPLVADSSVISAINMGVVKDGDFEFGANGCMLTASGRKAFLRTFENRLDQMVTHPVFGYKVSWRRIIRVQAELMSRYIQGDVPEYPGMVTR